MQIAILAKSIITVISNNIFFHFSTLFFLIGFCYFFIVDILCRDQKSRDRVDPRNTEDLLHLMRPISSTIRHRGRQRCRGASGDHTLNAHLPSRQVNDAQPKPKEP